MSKPLDVEDGVWYPWAAEGRHICCDCGLAHDVSTKRIKGRLYIRWRRNERSTAAVRRGKGKRQTHRSATDKKLYALRDAKGRFKDIQTYQRAHEIDLKRRAKK